MIVWRVGVVVWHTGETIWFVSVGVNSVRVCNRFVRSCVFVRVCLCAMDLHVCPCVHVYVYTCVRRFVRGRAVCVRAFDGCV